MSAFWKKWTSLLTNRRKRFPATRRPRRLLSLEELEPRIMLADDALLPLDNPAQLASVLLGPAQAGSAQTAPAPASAKSASARLASARQAREVFALPGLLGQTVPVRFTVTMRDAAFRNELGVVVVDDSSGRIGNLQPEDPGYAAAALAHPSRKVLFSGRPNAGDTKTVKLPARRHFIFYFVQNATAKDFLARNPGNQLDKTPPVFFSIKRANPDGIRHMRENPANVFGFEDIAGGGDKDYNDIAVRMNIGTPTGTPAPPRLGGRLSNDTAPGGTTNTDRITSDPSIAGTLTAGRKIIRFRAGFDAAPLSTYVSLLNDRGPGGSFLLDQARINQIAGGLLADGPHVLHLTAEDEAHKVALFDLAFTLDTTVPLAFDLAPEFDSAPLLDQQTTFETVTLRGQSEPGALVVLQDTGATTTTADAAGAFEFPGIALQHGPNDFALTATDLAGNSTTASRTIRHLHDDCGFDDALSGWTVSTSGGGDPGPGAVTGDGTDAVLREGSSFLVTLERTFTLPDQPSRLQFIFAGPAFDTRAGGAMKDAFEVALLDAGGAPLVFPFSPTRDAFFNISEGQPAALGAGTTISGATVTTDLSGLAPGSTFRLVFRLVNDDADTETSVRLSCVQIIAGAGISPRGVSGALATAANPSIDFSALSDVSGSLESVYARTSFKEDATVVYAELAARNRGQYEVAGPIVAVVTHLSNPAVRVRDFDGVTPAGLPYYEITGLAADGRLAAGEAGALRRIAFFNPAGAQFTYDLVFLGQLNRPPKITSTPDLEALAGRSYVYAAAASDPDNDPRAFSLLMAPAAMAIDSASGRITWSPETADVGNHVVVVRVDDGRGGSDEQTYTLAVRDNVPNRPPVFTSLPLVDAAVSTAYIYVPTVTDEDGDPLTFTLSGPAGMTIDPATGRLEWTPTAGELGLHYVSLAADDGHGGTAAQTFNINVSPAPENHAPVIVSDPSTRFLVELPGFPTGDVSPDLISLGIGEERSEQVSVRVPLPAPIGLIDFLPAALDGFGLTTDSQTLQLAGTLRVDVRNQGTDDYQSALAGTFHVTVFEDRNGNAAFDPGVDNVLGEATFAGTLGAGVTVALQIPVAGIVQFLDKPLYVMVDSDNVIPELDELNNTLATGLDSRFQPAGDWVPMVKWQWTPPVGTNAPQTLITVAPLIDTNGDGRINEHDVPAVLVNTVNNFSSTSLQLTALRGDTGQVIFSTTRLPDVTLDQLVPPTVVDLEGDGRPEILLGYGNILYAFNNDGTLKWRSQQPAQYGSLPVPVDLDGDGKSEILFGTAALNADGTIRWNSLNYSGNGRSDIGGLVGYHASARQPADLNLDGIKEVVAGRSAYTNDGRPLWAWQTVSDSGRYLAQRSDHGGPWVTQFQTPINLTDGWSAVVNLDDDPYPEIIVIHDGFNSTSPSMWIFNHDGSLYAPPVEVGGHTINGVIYWEAGPPTVADFDGDGRPEIAVTLRKQPTLYPPDITDPPRHIQHVLKPDGTVVWAKDLSSWQTGGDMWPSTAFDFDGDGAAELVHMDYDYLYVLDGRTGDTRFQLAINNVSQNGWPVLNAVVADLDNNGKAEIVLPMNPAFVLGSPLRQGVMVIGEVNGNWLHARRNWNEWAFHPAYTNEDGSVPAHARNSWEVDNSLRAQVPIEGVDVFAAPDLSVSQVTVDPANYPASVTITTRIGNGGSLQAGGGMRVDFYLGDPAAGGTWLGKSNTKNPLFPADFEDVSFEWAAPSAGQIVVTVNQPPPTPRVASSNLSLLPDSWARSSGFLYNSYIPVNRNAFYGIDGDSNTRWYFTGGPQTSIDPGPHFYEVHFPFPVEVAGVTIQNQRSGSDLSGFLGVGTLTFSNGFSTTIDLGTTGAGTVAFPVQTGITWIHLTAAVDSGGPGLSEFRVAGSYVRPTFLTPEGAGRLGNNRATLTIPALAGGSPPPAVQVGPDQTVFDGDTVSLNPASFTDPVILETHTATIDWDDGTVEAGTVSEANNSGAISGSHLYATEGTYVVTVTVRDAAGNTDVDSFTVSVLNANLRESPIDVIASDPSVAFTNLTGPLAGIGPNQVAAFDVRLTGPDMPARFDLLFVRSNGVELGSIPVTVNDTYRYQVAALDGDGDPITYRLLQGPTGAAIDAGTGLLTWTPSLPGTYSFLVEAADNRGGATTQDYFLTVAAGTNQSPTITSTPPDRAILFRDFSYRVTATDADGDNLSFSLTSAPAGMAMDSAMGVVTWRPSAAQLGTQTVTVTVRDVRGGLATQTFDLEVTRDLANQAPLITSTAEIVADPGALYRYQATATDAENDPLRFDLPLKPAGMTIQPLTGVLVWTPRDNQVGTHDVIVRVRDSQDAVTLQHFQLTVREPNSLPFIVSQSPPQAIEGLPFEYQVQAQDTAGEILIFRADAFPSGMTIDSMTGVLSWTPGAGQLGTQDVTVGIEDDRSGVTTQSFTIQVVADAPNDLPEILSTPRTTIALGSPYFYQVRAVDPNADPLTFQLTSLPAGMSIDGNGLVSWDPAASQFGTNPVEIRVEDGRGGVAVQSFTVEVVSTLRNQPPRITSTPLDSAVAGRLFAYDMQVVDPDGDPLSFTLISGPRGMSIHPELGTVRWLPGADQLGTQNIVLQVLDTQGGSATQSFQIAVRSINTPPLITSTPPTEAAANVLYTYSVRASDRDGDSLTFSLQTFPVGMTIDPASGLIEWTPSDLQVGTQQVAVLADDGLSGTATQSYTIVVSAVPANLPPAITSTPSQVATVGTAYEYQVTAADPEGQPVEFLLVEAPAGMGIDAAGLITWFPGQAGSFPVTVLARDPDGATARQRFTLDAADNGPPMFTSQPVLTATAGKLYHYDMLVSDPDSDPLRYELEQGPAGMALDVGTAGGQTLGGAFGRLTWTPGVADVGTTHTVRLRAIDARFLSAVQEFEIAVAPDSEAPRVSVQLTPNPVAMGTPATVLVLASDNIGVQVLNLTVNGIPVALDSNGRGSVIMSEVGQFDVLATATDAAANSGTATASLLVFDPAITGAPTVSLTSPDEDAEVTAPTEVIGTVNDDNLLSWSLAVALAGTQSFTEIARGTTPIIDGVLGKFDPSLLTNDSYTLRLTAINAGGKTATAERTVNVSGNLKLGNFTLSFTDVSIPVSGIPIQVTRTYDTMQAGQAGELGFGWRLEFRDTRLRTNLPMTGLEEFGIFTAFRDGTKVYITLPGGRREGFTFRPKEEKLIHTRIYIPQFDSDRGVTSRLMPAGRVVLFRRGDEYVTEEGLPYNPADPTFGGGYTLTTRDGIRPGSIPGNSFAFVGGKLGFF